MEGTPQHHSQNVANSSSSIEMIKEFVRQSWQIVFMKPSFLDDKRLAEVIPGREF